VGPLAHGKSSAQRRLVASCPNYNSSELASDGPGVAISTGIAYRHRQRQPKLTFSYCGA
jgi:hypothetical protein